MAQAPPIELSKVEIHPFIEINLSRKPSCRNAIGKPLVEF